MRTKRGAFLISLVVGAAAVTYFALAQNRPAAFVAGALAVLAHWALTANKSQDEESADASYFLGFLLTLVLLAVGLWTLGRPPAPEAAGRVGEVSLDLMPFLLDLAVGLAITVVGLAVRQLRVLGIDASPESPPLMALHGDFQQLVTAQQALVSGIGDLSQRLEQSGFMQTVEGTSTALAGAQRAARNLGQTLDEAAGTMKSAARNLVRTVSSTTTRLDTATSQLSESWTHSIERTSAQVAYALESLEAQRARVEEALDASVKAAERTQRELESELGAQVTSWKQALEQTHGFLVALHANIETEYDVGMQSVRRATDTFNRLSQRVVEEIESLPDPSERLEKLWVRLQQLDDLLSTSARGTAYQLQQFGDGANGARDAMMKLASGADSAAERVRVGGDDMGDTLRKELQQVQQLLAEFHHALHAGLTAIEGR